MSKVIMGRIEYTKPSNYNYCVKTGPWVEETHRYIKECYKHDSTYNTDYLNHGRNARCNSHLWNNKFAGEGVNPKIDQDHDYLDNFASLYDLSYNHFPRCFKGSLKRHWSFKDGKYEPEIDYALNYGCVTRYGLFDLKKEAWDYDNCHAHDHSTPIPLYNEEYIPPNVEAFRFKRHATPLPNSTKITDPLLYRLGLRGQRTFFSPDAEKLVVVTPEPRCNPITWACPKELDHPPRRCIEEREGRNSPYYGIPSDIPYECVRASYQRRT